VNDDEECIVVAYTMIYCLYLQIASSCYSVDTREGCGDDGIQRSSISANKTNAGAIVHIASTGRDALLMLLLRSREATNIACGSRGTSPLAMGKGAGGIMYCWLKEAKRLSVSTAEMTTERITVEDMSKVTLMTLLAVVVFVDTDVALSLDIKSIGGDTMASEQ